MKLYRIDWSDPSEGNCMAWSSSLADAKKRKTDILSEYSADKPSAIIRLVNVPTNKASLLAWLNTHVIRDNG